MLNVLKFVTHRTKKKKNNEFRTLAETRGFCREWFIVFQLQ